MSYGAERVSLIASETPIDRETMIDTETAPPVAEIAKRVETIRETLYLERCVRGNGRAGPPQTWVPQ